MVVNVIGLILFSSNATLAAAGGHSHSHGHSHGHNHARTTASVAYDSAGARAAQKDGAQEGGAVAAIDDNVTVAAAPSDDIEACASVESPPRPSVHKSANLHAVFLHVLGDALGSVGVIITGLIIMFVPYDWKYYFDPLLSMLLAIIIGKASIPVVRQSAQLLLQSVPESIDLNVLSRKMLHVPGVDYVGSIHVWALNNDDRVASAHIDCLKSCDFDQVSSDIKQLFSEFGIANVTIEPHFVDNPLPVDVNDKMHLASFHGKEFRCE